MDSLLASYGSDDEDEQEEEEEEKVITAPPPKVSLFGRLPAPRNSVSLPPPKVETGSKPSLFAALPPPKVQNPNDGTSTSKPTFLGALPPPKVEEFDGNPRTLFASLPPPKIEKIDTSLFAALPPPKVEFDSSKVKAEPGVISNPKAKKQSVTFKPPIDVSILEDDDDDWRPSQKKAKAEAPSSTTGGGGLSSLLPAPKHSLGLGSTLGTGATSGGRRAAMEVATTTQDLKPETIARISTTTKNEAQAPEAHVQYDNSAYAVHVKNEAQAPEAYYQYDNSTYAVDVKSETQASQDQAHYDNAAHAVDESTAYHPQYANEYHDPSYPSQASYADPVAQDWHDPSYPASQASSVDPLAQVLQAQRRRGREDRMPAPNVIEVKQADLTGGRKLREDQIRTTGIAFGPAYQPSSKDKGSKIHRRKHQIGTLLQDSKAKEMDLLERRARGNLTKAETQAKYGW